MSPGLRAMNDQAAAAGPFAKAARLLENLAGVHLTVKRVERAAEASGTAAAAAVRDRAALITARKLVPLPPSPLPDKLYAAIDGTGVPVTAKETAGRDGKGEDGRARTREAKLGVFFTQNEVDDGGYPVRDQDSSSYVATFEPARVFAGLVEAEGIRRGAGHVRQRPRPAPGIHARRPETGMACRPPGGPRLRRHRRHLQGRHTYPLAGIKKYELDTALGYFENNAPRMRYKWFRSCGLFVGPGADESGCKAVIGQRLKLSGMHWTVAGASAITTLRCQQASRPQDQIWLAARNQTPAA
jgi:hypothetical protein